MIKRLILKNEQNYKQMKYLLFFTSFLLLSCNRSETKITDQIVSVNLNSEGAFEHIGTIVGNKEIVILGESEHGDGKTHEVKSRIINYLVEEKGFNTLAFEGTGFLDMQLVNSPIMDNFLPDKFRRNWLNLWAQSNQKKN